MMTEFRDGGEYENMQSEKWQKTLCGVLCRPYCGGKTGARRGLGQHRYGRMALLKVRRTG